jgi:hypothetical protein
MKGDVKVCTGFSWFRVNFSGGSMAMKLQVSYQHEISLLDE